MSKKGGCLVLVNDRWQPIVNERLTHNYPELCSLQIEYRQTRVKDHPRIKTTLYLKDHTSTNFH